MAENNSMPSDTGENFHGLLNEIITCLWVGEAWHGKAANECRKIAIRGVGRWHEVESCYDMKARISLEKLLRDKLEYAPMADMAEVDKAHRFTMNNAVDFKSHFSAWVEREKKLIEILNFAIAKASAVDMELYKGLCCLVDEVQNETMRAKLVYERFELSNWSGHDIGVCSMVLHKYFECEYDGGKIDFNIG